MRRFIIQSLIFSLIVIGTLAAGFYLRPIHRNNYLYAFKAKERMLINTPSPKIVFIGGSNIAFGLRSDMVSDTFNIPVVNTGLHAAIGLRFMIETTVPWLNPNAINLKISIETLATIKQGLPTLLQK